MTIPAVQLFATAPRGLQDLLAAELSDLGLSGVRAQRGGAVFSGHLADACRACLWSRVANRVLLPIAQFEAADDDALYRGAGAIDWSAHLGPENTLAVDFTGIKAAVSHSHFAAQRVKDAVVDQLRRPDGARPSVDVRQPDVRINVHMHGQNVTVAIDLSGESLHKRGYRDSNANSKYPRLFCRGIFTIEPIVGPCGPSVGARVFAQSYISLKPSITQPSSDTAEKRRSPMLPTGITYRRRFS